MRDGSNMPKEYKDILQRSSMHLRLYILSTLLLLTLCATGQSAEQYRIYKQFEDETVEVNLSQDSTTEPESSPYENVHNRSIFNQNSVVINHQRGVGYFQQSEWFEGIELPKLGYSRSKRLSLRNSSLDALGIVRYTQDSSAIKHTEVGINLATRNYLGGITASTVKDIGNWLLCCEFGLRTGRDSHIKGVFTNEATLNLCASTTLGSKNNLILALLFTPSERGLRKASFAEAFALTSDNYYNPAWGYQSGKIRNTNTITTIQPTALAAFSHELNSQHKLNIALAATVGSRAYSGLDWLGSSTPLPDNYRYLPSYYTDALTSEAISSAWQNGDSRYTQINFDELHRRNSLQNQSIYILNNRVTRRTKLQLSASIDRTFNQSLRLKYGVRGTIDRQRNFKQVKDLLSGGAFEDIDFFLVDDDTQSNMLLNDLNHPARKIGQSDRYGYDYALTECHLSLFSEIKYTTDRLKVDGYLSLGNSTARRRGYYRKELFAANSFGRSKLLSFADCAAHLAVQYSPSRQHHISASAAAIFRPAEAQNLFLQSEYNNLTVNNPRLTSLLSASATYHLTLNSFRLRTSLFARYHARQTDVAHAYYDAASEYADIVTSDLATLATGIEVEARYNINNHLSMAAGVTYGRYRYSGSPTVAVYADKDNRLLSEDQINDISNLRTGLTPELSALASLNYYNRGWGANLSAEYHAMRYVLPSLVRRTESILNHTTTSEQRAALISQERLPDAFCLNLTLSKSFYLKGRKAYANSAAPTFTQRHPKSKITVFIAVNNLLGNRNIVFRGYESTRIRKQYKWDDFTATPFASYYLYAYPRTYFLQVKFSF